jgi:hypothetical protein
MDPMVIKYLALAGITYGTHAFLAVAQVLLCVYLVANGIALFSSKESLGKWAGRFGLVVNEYLRANSLNSWLMIGTGIALILPLLGMSYWLAVTACPITIYWIIKITKGLTDPRDRKVGSVMRKGLAVSAVLVFGFTIWEARDLVYAGWDVNYKAIYWRHKEVTVWQKDNNPHVPKVGTMAPDFELSDATGTKTVRLSDFRGKKPVVLLFGSFT